MKVQDVKLPIVIDAGLLLILLLCRSTRKRHVQEEDVYAAWFHNDNDDGAVNWDDEDAAMETQPVDTESSTPVLATKVCFTETAAKKSRVDNEKMEDASVNPKQYPRTRFYFCRNAQCLLSLFTNESQPSSHVN
jgi:hypothetical protein